MQQQYRTQQVRYSESCSTEDTRPAATEGRVLVAAVSWSGNVAKSNHARVPLWSRPLEVAIARCCPPCAGVRRPLSGALGGAPASGLFLRCFW